MAWLDDRAWVHPKVVDLSNPAFRVWVTAILYSAGMELQGVLTTAQQRLIGANPKLREEILAARLWDELPDGRVLIHDWQEHNGRRDARKKSDRERQKRHRDKQRDSTRDIERDKPRDRRALTGDRVTEVEPNGSTRERNPIWDALTEVFGEPTTDSARTLRGKVCSSLTRAGASPEEIVSRAKSWPRHFEHATLTETALEKHWDALGRRPLRLEQR